MRKALKLHLTKTKKDGKPRCPGLKKVLSTKEWDEQVLPYYTSNAEFPNLLGYKLKSPSGKRKRKPIKELPKGDSKKRLIKDNLINELGECVYTKDKLLSMLFAVCDNDERWLLRKWEKNGAAEIRRKRTASKPQKSEKMPPRQALELKLFTGLTRRGYQLFRAKLPYGSTKW